MNELLRNGSGYVDWTAYKAMTNVMKEQVNNMTCNHGDIVELEMKGSGETKTAIVVSADWRANDRFVNVIVMTDEPKGQVSVQITTKNGIMYADCGMVSFAASERMACYIQTAKAAEIQKLEQGIADCLGFGTQVIEKEVVKEVIKEVPKEVIKEVSTGGVELAKAQAEAEVYKSLYEQLLKKMLKG